MFRSLVYRISLLCFIAHGTYQNKSASPDTVTTRYGSITGTPRGVLGTTVVEFLGIPYAEPPVGDLRFQRPRSFTGSLENYNATQPPNYCPQPLDDMYARYQNDIYTWNPLTTMSEDCLYLNVWAPAGGLGGVNGLKPVMVWIYGGAFQTGSSDFPLYNGKYLASHDVIVVSMQYRVGVFGFFYLGQDDAPGNMGLLDQYIAINWVHENIAAFGGDNTRITLFGESAGAASVNAHTLTSLKKLHQRAIMQSPPSLTEYTVKPEGEAFETSMKFAEDLNCAIRGDESIDEIISCMKAIPAKDMVETLTQTETIYSSLTSTVDGLFFQRAPEAQYGVTAGIPTIVGTTKDEGAMLLLDNAPKYLTMQTKPSISQKKYLRTLKSYTKLTDVEDLQQLHDLYDEIHCEYIDVLIDMIGDQFFVCPSVDIARQMSANNDVYYYKLEHATAANDWPSWTGVMHGYEIDLVFGIPLDRKHSIYTEEDRELARTMVQYWVNFAKSGNPNFGQINSSVTWERFADTAQAMVFKVPKVEMEPLELTEQCHFWLETYNELLMDQPSLQTDNTTTNVTFPIGDSSYCRQASAAAACLPYSLFAALFWSVILVSYTQLYNNHII